MSRFIDPARAKQFTEISRSFHLPSTELFEVGSMKSFLLSTLLAVAASSLVIAEDPLREARVSIPYEELKSLLKAAAIESTDHKTKPPVAAALNSALYRLDFSEGDPSFTASFEVRGYGEGWHSVPVFGGAPR